MAEGASLDYQPRYTTDYKGFSPHAILIFGRRDELCGLRRKGDNTRAFLYVRDAADAIIDVLENRTAAAGASIVNVGSDEEIAMRRLGERLLACVGEAGREMVVYPPPEGNVSRRCPDIARLRGEFGFRPGIGLDTGLRRTADWYYFGVDNVCNGDWMEPEP